MDLADAHAHLFASGFAGLYRRACSGGDDVAVYESLRQEHRIDTTLVVGYEGDPAYRGNNEYLARLANVYNWMVPLAYTPPTAPRVPAPPFAGISVYLSTSADARRFANWPREVLNGLANSAMIVSVNAPPEALARLSETVRRLEGCQVLISHLGQPGSYEESPSAERVAEVLRPLLSLASVHHLGVKLSGLYDISIPPYAYPHAAARPFVERIADAFGSERLYWGSDFSPALDHVSFAQTVGAVADLAWSDSERGAIMGDNLRRLVMAMRRARGAEQTPASAQP